MLRYLFPASARETACWWEPQEAFPPGSFSHLPLNWLPSSSPTSTSPPTPFQFFRPAEMVGLGMCPRISEGERRKFGDGPPPPQPPP